MADKSLEQALVDTLTKITSGVETAVTKGSVVVAEHGPQVMQSVGNGIFIWGVMKLATGVLLVVLASVCLCFVCKSWKWLNDNPPNGKNESEGSFYVGVILILGAMVILLSGIGIFEYLLNTMYWLAVFDPIAFVAAKAAGVN